MSAVLSAPVQNAAMEYADVNEASIMSWKVLVSLSVSQPNSIELPERRIRLYKSRLPVRIGRSSNRAQVDLEPAVNNGWFNSPVMSRKQAEITADIPSNTVFIRDLDSMHGTYLNKERVTGEATPLHPGDELVFGMPVYRHDTSFEPVHVTVDSLEFKESVLQTTTPTRVFTVPDDCSTDDNEPPEDEPVSSSSNPLNNIDEEIPNTLRDRRSSIPQLDGVTDLVSEASDVESLAVNLEEVHEEEGDGTHCGVRAIEIPEDDEESLDLTDVDMNDTPPLAHRNINSPVWETSSSCSDNSHMDEHEHEGDATDYGSYGSERSSIPMSDLESEGEDIPGHLSQFDDDSVSSGFQQNMSLGLSSPLVSPLPAQSWQHTPRWLPPINSLIPLPLGCNTLAGLDPNRARLSSPHNAVLPHSHYRPDTVNVKQQSTNDSESAVPQTKSLDADVGQASTATLGSKSGMPEVFDARERIGTRFTRLSEQSLRHFHSEIASDDSISAPAPGSPKASVLLRPSILLDDIRDTCHIEKNTVTHGTENEAVGVKQSIPLPLGPPISQFPIPRPETASFTNCDRSTDHFLGMGYRPWPTSHCVDYIATTPVTIGDAENKSLKEAASAWEFQQKNRELDERERYLPVYSSLSNLASREQRVIEPCEDSSATETQKQTENKRKAEMISVVTEADMTWVASDSSPPTAPPLVVARPNKVARKIVERVGYAALGGATVGAMVLTSLIYSAPTFV